MSNLSELSPSGWNKWVYPKTTISGIQLADASLPVEARNSKYLPSNSFWLKAIIDHCNIPWLNTFDPFTTFMLAGGASSTIPGSVSGLAAVALTFELSVAGETYGLTGNASGPRVGYCVGNIFKQQGYMRFDIQNNVGEVILLDAVVEMLENSRFRRIYVNHGEVSSYDKDKNVVSIGIEKDIPPPNIDVGGTIMNVYKKDGKILRLNIEKINKDWTLSVKKQDKDLVPESGDFYELNITFLIEDPYMMCGLGFGTEQYLNLYSSGLGLYGTAQNNPYQMGKFLGVYIWKAKDKDSKDKLFMPSAGKTMSDSSEYEWDFLYFGNTSEIYSDGKRYKEVKLDEANEEGAYVEYGVRSDATESDYNAIISDPDSNYLRVEIETGGYRNRHNWYAPCLKGSYIKVNGKTYKILDHIEANILDVSIISVDGSTKLNPKINQNYSIINQYAWMITENYFQNAANYLNTGMFEGDIKVATRKNIVIETLLIPMVARLKTNGLSLVDRYQETLKDTSVLKNIYKKFERLKLCYDNDIYDIETINFEIIGSDVSQKKYSEGNKYKIIIILKDEVAGSAQRAYIDADIPYKTYGSFSAKAGVFFTLDIKPALDGKGQGFITSNKLCANGEFFSNPYAINVPVDTRIGSCDGLRFGIDANGSAQSSIGNVFFVTTPSVDIGVSSLFHDLRQEDWAFFQDPVTRRITIRRGLLGFKDYPNKNMVVIGDNVEYVKVDSSNNSIALDENKDWVRRIQFKNEERTIKNVGIMFGVKNPKSIYGFYVSGDGTSDLELYRKQGLSNVAGNAYTSDGYSVSPVYVYLRQKFEPLTYTKVDIGVRSDNKNIYFNNCSGNFSDVEVGYIKDDQTIEGNGYFDCIRLNTGEIFFLYNAQVGEFTVNGQLNNSAQNGTKWQIKNSIMIVGSNDDSYYWGAPLLKSAFINTEEMYEKSKLPVMLMNSVDYITSMYNPINNTLCVFARCYYEAKKKDGTIVLEPYIGCLTVSILSLVNNLYVCERLNNNTDDVLFDFSYRVSNIKSINSVVIGNETGELVGSQDHFVKIIGPEITSCNIISVGDIGTITASILNSGYYLMFYDSENGIKMAFSNNGGNSWQSSDIIFAKNGRCGLLLGGYLFYINDSGIIMKNTNVTVFEGAINLVFKKQEGKTVSDSEISMQKTLDTMSYTALGSGPIEDQRLSGYITPSGIIKIFFYDSSNLLKCMELGDGVNWKIADNF